MTDTDARSARIHESLARVLERHRIVFWYDGAKEWRETFDAFAFTGAIKLYVDNSELSAKIQISEAPESRFLVYIPNQRPSDANNWLLDLLLQGHEYRADRASLALQEVGLPQDFRNVAEEHALFFNNVKRVEALKTLLSVDDQSSDIRLKMMAVLNNTAANVDSLLLNFLGRGSGVEHSDPVVEALGSAALVEHFWREVARSFGYSPPAPSIRDFAVALFRGANPLDRQATLHPHSRVFFQRWKDSQTFRGAFREWSKRMERDLQISVALDATEPTFAIADSDAFELFEKFAIHGLSRSFARGTSTMELRSSIQLRRASFWHEAHADGYAALEHAIILRDLLQTAEIAIETLDVGVRRYISNWWRIDTAYRRCVYHLRRYGQVQLMESISDWAEKAYVNNFLLPLCDRWSDQVRKLETWRCEGLTAQSRFFETYVQPFASKGQKVFVIVSDALRYEAASEYAERLRSANRWTADIDALFGALPSYTQLGMAALLPGRVLAVDPKSSYVTVDGRSASGTSNRAQILATEMKGRAMAVQSEEFLELNTKTDGRALMRDHDVVYIFHNHIDKVGDTTTTEAKTFDAVAATFDELDLIIRKVANINGSNMLLTADHGFLFQQDAVGDSDMAPVPDAAELTYRNRRFVFGRDIKPSNNLKVFSSSALGIAGDWSAAFPLSLSRFRVPGSGRRYVHGGTSLQEVLIPVVRIHKARADDVRQVDVDPLRLPAKITTGQLAIALFQDQPALDKVLPRTLRVGLYAKDGTPLSELKTHVFDSKETEPRLREITIVLALGHAANAHNNQQVELRLEETVPGTNQLVTYRSHDIKLQKPFMSDFDDN